MDSIAALDKHSFQFVQVIARQPESPHEYGGQGLAVRHST